MWTIPMCTRPYWLYLLTVARKEELLQAKWQDVDWYAKQIRLPKPGGPYYIPLSNEAISILKELPRLPDNPYIFPGKNPGRPIVNLNKTWKSVRKRAGIPDVTIHDLRRTAASWMAQDGCTLRVIGELLNHQNDSSTAIYARFSRRHLNEAVESYASRLIEITGEKSRR